VWERSRVATGGVVEDSVRLERRDHLAPSHGSGELELFWRPSLWISDYQSRVSR